MSDQGTPFGNYRLLKRLARGGMAEVFLAEQKGPQGFDRRVALKRILPHLMESEDFVRMFHDEAKLAARLSHPNVVHIYEFGQADNHYFIAMEFVDGVHTGQLIEHGPTELIPPVLAARIGADACAGLNYAHRLEDNDGNPLKLVHRDISPPNLMISYDGVVKVVDFGIAKAVDMAGKTRPGIVKGKFAYMSPEQTMGRKLDGRSDVFSLGICMWEILAGRVALDRTDPVEAMKCIRDGRMPSILEARPDVPKGLVEVLDMALTMKVNQRPSAAELGNAFESFIKSSPELATPMQLSEWIRERFKRRKVAESRPVIPASKRPRSSTPSPAQRAEAKKAAMAFMQDAEEMAESAHIGGLPPVKLPGPRPLGAPGPQASGFGPPPAILASEESLTDVTPLPVAQTRPPGSFGGPGASAHNPPVPLTPGAPTPVGQFPAARYPADQRKRKLVIAASVGALLLLIIIVALASGGDDSPGGRGSESDADAAVTAHVSDARGSVRDAGAPDDASATPDDGDDDDDDDDGDDDDDDTIVAVKNYDAGVGADGDTVWVVVKTEPDGASVSIDGSPSKKSPALFDGLTLGEHKIEIRRSGYRTVRQTLALQPGMSEVSYALSKGSTRKKRGKLNLFTRPSCTAYAGKKRLGTTPFAGKKLEAGRHTITCKKSGYKTAKKRIRIRSGKTTKAKLTLKKK